MHRQYKCVTRWHHLSCSITVYNIGPECYSLHFHLLVDCEALACFCPIRSEQRSTGVVRTLQTADIVRIPFVNTNNVHFCACIFDISRSHHCSTGSVDLLTLPTFEILFQHLTQSTFTTSIATISICRTDRCNFLTYACKHAFNNFH
jgi:hypothetical protein